MQRLDPAALAFRAMTASDIPLLRLWLAEPHVARWFTPDHGDALAEAIAADSPIHPFIVTHASVAIGMIAWERLIDFPDVMSLYEVTDDNTINCDVFIGHSAYVARGLGGPLVTRFLKDLAAQHPHITACAIDPVIDNKPAIRAYEKAGFHWTRNVPDGEGNTVYLMELQLR